jgi:hypothetical protein
MTKADILIRDRDKFFLTLWCGTIIALQSWTMIEVVQLGRHVAGLTERVESIKHSTRLSYQTEEREFVTVVNNPL